MWHKVWPKNIYVSHWPIFHGTVIQPYNLNIIWWTNPILWILVQWDKKILWNIYGSLTYISWFCKFDLHISSAYSLKFDSENVCECSKVRNRSVVYSRGEMGASDYFGHISRWQSILNRPAEAVFHKLSWHCIADSLTKMFQTIKLLLKEKGWKQWNLTKAKVFLKPNCLLQISCKSDNK